MNGIWVLGAVPCLTAYGIASRDTATITEVDKYPVLSDALARTVKDAVILAMVATVKKCRCTNWHSSCCSDRWLPTRMVVNGLLEWMPMANVPQTLCQSNFGKHSIANTWTGQFAPSILHAPAGSGGRHR